MLTDEGLRALAPLTALTAVSPGQLPNGERCRNSLRQKGLDLRYP
jgi:hypothetical protein